MTDRKRGIKVKVGGESWAVWASGHGLGNRFVWAAARAMWRQNYCDGGMPRERALVKNLAPDEREGRACYLNQFVVLSGPTVRERWMQRHHGSYYADEDSNWYVELYDAPAKGRWPVTVIEL